MFTCAANNIGPLWLLKVNEFLACSELHIVGDTANKIGTYSLALSAKHHGIPFYVAAPFTSIDLSISSGEEIVIEERSAKELLHARGGLGEQVAASGISVWNPAFDVTPATIISGIITEKVTLISLSDTESNLSLTIKIYLHLAGSYHKRWDWIFQHQKFQELARNQW